MLLKLDDMSSTPKLVGKSLNSPDDVRSFEKGKIETVTLGDSGVTIGRSTFEPGWSWDKCVKPVVKTDSCDAPHTAYIVSGRIKVVMDDGSEAEGGPGDAALIPRGQHAWVIGDEPCVMIDFTGAKDYAKPN